MSKQIEEVKSELQFAHDSLYLLHLQWQEGGKSAPNDVRTELLDSMERLDNEIIALRGVLRLLGE